MPPFATPYLGRRRQYQERDEFTCYASNLMSNHVHLLVGSGAVPLSRSMQTLLFTSSQYYNCRYRKQEHQAQYYETVDQRFLGDERFLEAIERKSAPFQEIARKERPVPFPRVLGAVAEATGIPVASLV